MDDLLGWQTTRWNMTEAQVIEATGGAAQPPDKVEQYANARGRLTIPNVKIGEFDFTVVFQFAMDKDALIRVLVKHDDDPSARPSQAFGAAKAVLVERFGPGSRVGTSADWGWDFKTTSVRLSATHIDGVLNFVAIMFAPADTMAPKSVPAF